MTLTFAAVVEKDGRIRPLTSVDLAEGTEVAVTVDFEPMPVSTRRPAEILAAIATLPLQGPPDPRASIDHDQILYGRKVS